LYIPHIFPHLTRLPATLPLHCGIPHAHYPRYIHVYRTFMRAAFACCLPTTRSGSGWLQRLVACYVPYTHTFTLLVAFVVRVLLLVLAFCGALHAPPHLYHATTAPTGFHLPHWRGSFRFAAPRGCARRAAALNATTRPPGKLPHTPAALHRPPARLVRFPDAGLVARQREHFPAANWRERTSAVLFAAVTAVLIPGVCLA